MVKTEFINQLYPTANLPFFGFEKIIDGGSPDDDTKKL
jgi:hypothetical protein